MKSKYSNALGNKAAFHVLNTTGRVVKVKTVC